MLIYNYLIINYNMCIIINLLVFKVTIQNSKVVCTIFPISSSKFVLNISENFFPKNQIAT